MAKAKTVKCPHCDLTGLKGAVSTHAKHVHISEAQYSKNFFAKVDKNSPGGCWLWTGCKDSWGRGALTVRGRRTFAHIISWEILRGIPRNGLFLCHTCDVRHCCNPDHLYLGTDADNHRDMQVRGRARYNSHPKLTEEQVREIRRDYRMGNGRVLAKRYGVSNGTVTEAARGATWKHIK